MRSRQFRDVPDMATAFAPKQVSGLLQLPTELILDVADHFDCQNDIHDIWALATTCRRMYSDLRYELIRHDARSGRCAALHHAASTGHMHIAESSLAAGAGVDTLMLLRCHWYRYLPSLLEKHRFDHFTPVQLAIAYGHEDIAKLFVEHGADIDGLRLCPDSHRLTLLHMASGRGLVSLMKLLLERGAKVQTRDAHGQTPLHHAVRPSLYACSVYDRWGSGSTSAVALLLEHGANMRTPDRHGYTPYEFFIGTKEVMSAYSDVTKPPPPPSNHEIGELLHNKKRLLKVQELDKRRAKRLAKKAKEGKPGW